MLEKDLAGSSPSPPSSNGLSRLEPMPDTGERDAEHDDGGDDAAQDDAEDEDSEKDDKRIIDGSISDDDSLADEDDVEGVFVHKWSDAVGRLA